MHIRDLDDAMPCRCRGARVPATRSAKGALLVGRNSQIVSVGLALHPDRGVAEARKGAYPCFAPAPQVTDEARRGSRRPNAALTTASTVTAH